MRAVLAERGANPTLAHDTAQALTAEIAAGEGSSLPAVMQALSRPTRIVRGKADEAAATVDEALLECDEERALHAALRSVHGRMRAGMPLREWLQVARELEAPIGRFFDNVFVMADDAALRGNRLALLRNVAAIASGVLDPAELPGF